MQLRSRKGETAIACTRHLPDPSAATLLPEAHPTGYTATATASRARTIVKAQFRLQVPRTDTARDSHNRNTPDKSMTRHPAFRFAAASGRTSRKDAVPRTGEAPAEPSSMVCTRPSRIETGESPSAYFWSRLSGVPWEPRNRWRSHRTLRFGRSLTLPLPVRARFNEPFALQQRSGCWESVPAAGRVTIFNRHLSLPLSRHRNQQS